MPYRRAAMSGGVCRGNARDGVEGVPPVCGIMAMAAFGYAGGIVRHVMHRRPTAVFVVGEVPDIMDPVPGMPVVADQGQRLLGSGGLRAEWDQAPVNSSYACLGFVRRRSMHGLNSHDFAGKESRPCHSARGMASGQADRPTDRKVRVSMPESGGPCGDRNRSWRQGRTAPRFCPVRCTCMRIPGPGACLSARRGSDFGFTYPEPRQCIGFATPADTQLKPSPVLCRGHSGRTSQDDLSDPNSGRCKQSVHHSMNRHCGRGRRRTSCRS